LPPQVGGRRVNMGMGNTKFWGYDVFRLPRLGGGLDTGVQAGQAYPNQSRWSTVP
jgi:hypothetical protein